MNCQNFYTMNLIKQSLCRRWAAQACRATLWLSLTVWLAHAGGAVAAKPAPVQPSLDPVEQLNQAVTQWVGRQQGIAPAQVQLQPLDSRVRIQSCAVPLNMDLPFASPESVRVRCTQPAWQLYVRVKLPQQALKPASPEGQAMVAENRRPVLVLVSSLTRGMSIQPQDVRLQPMALPSGSGPYLEDPAEASHAELVRDLPAGTPLRRADLKPMVLVKRGQVVQLNVGKATGFTVSAKVEALQDGRSGEHIRLKNVESGRMISGVVKGPNLVEGL